MVEQADHCSATCTALLLHVILASTPALALLEGGLAGQANLTPGKVQKLAATLHVLPNPCPATGVGPVQPLW